MTIDIKNLKIAGEEEIQKSADTLSEELRKIPLQDRHSKIEETIQKIGKNINVEI